VPSTFCSTFNLLSKVYAFPKIHPKYTKKGTLLAENQEKYKKERLFKSIGADWAVDWVPFGCKSVKCQMPLPFCLPMHLDGLSAGQPGAYFIFLLSIVFFNK